MSVGAAEYIFLLERLTVPVHGGPLAMVLDGLPVDWDSRCGYCGRDIGALGAFCGRCRGVKYCGPRCQRAHWAVHRDDCQRLADIRRVQAPEVPVDGGCAPLLSQRI